MLVAADNEVVMHSNAHRFRGFYNLEREGDIGSGGRRITGGMIVDQNHGRSAKIQSPLDHLADIDRSVIDGPLSLLFVLE